MAVTGKSIKKVTANTDVITGPFYVRSIRWVLFNGAAGDRCIVTDSQDLPVTEFASNSTQSQDTDYIEEDVSGLKFPTLAANSVIYVCIGKRRVG